MHDAAGWQVFSAPTHVSKLTHWSPSIVNPGLQRQPKLPKRFSHTLLSEQSLSSGRAHSSRSAQPSWNRVNETFYAHFVKPYAEAQFMTL